MLLYMLECTTLHKAEEKPMLSSLRQGGLRYVAVQSGKSCQRSARKSRAASKHMYLCCALMMRRTRRLTADRIHPLRREGSCRFAQTTCMKELPFPSSHEPVWQLQPTFYRRICFLFFTSASGVLQNKLETLCLCLWFLKCVLTFHLANYAGQTTDYFPSD